MQAFGGKTVLITGASTGIGRALALALAGEQACLALNARDATRLAQTARECAARGAEVLSVPGDVSHQEDCVRIVAQTLARFGGLDVLVNNAGITMWSRLDAVSDLAVYQRLLAVNYLGAVYTTAAALPYLKSARGLIVAVASIAGITGVPERTGYAASKHAMVGFFESLRIELAGSGVDVTINGRPDVKGKIDPKRPMPAAPHPSWRSRRIRASARGRFGRWARLIVPGVVDRLAARAIRDRC